MTPRLDCYLDRFEGDLAVLLVDGEEKAITASMLPVDAREGDHLMITIDRDTDARDRTEAEVSELQQELKRGNAES